MYKVWGIGNVISYYLHLSWAFEFIWTKKNGVVNMISMRKYMWIRDIGSNLRILPIQLYVKKGYWQWSKDPSLIVICEMGYWQRPMGPSQRMIKSRGILDILYHYQNELNCIVQCYCIWIWWIMLDCMYMLNKVYILLAMCWVYSLSCDSYKAQNFSRC